MTLACVECRSLQRLHPDAMLCAIDAIIAIVFRGAYAFRNRALALVVARISFRAMMARRAQTALSP